MKLDNTEIVQFDPERGFLVRNQDNGHETWFPRSMLRSSTYSSFQGKCGRLRDLVDYVENGPIFKEFFTRMRRSVRSLEARSLNLLINGPGSPK